MSRRLSVELAAGLILVALVAVASLLPMPYVALSPGPVFDTLGEQDGQPLIAIEGTTTYPTNGRLDLTTVSEQGGPRSRLGFLTAVKQWLDPDAVVVPERTLYSGEETAEEIDQRNAEDMELSQENAITAAVTHLGIPTTVEVVVRSIAEGGPALGILQAGDVILAVDGTTVTSAVQSRDLGAFRARLGVHAERDGASRVAAEPFTHCGVGAGRKARYFDGFAAADVSLRLRPICAQSRVCIAAWISAR
jgi:PDZ domain-containing protein